MTSGGGPSGRHVWLAPAYVLHQYAYRDTSRIVEMFTCEYGRLSVFARGANGPKSALKGVLRPFQRLLVSFMGRGEAVQLVSAEIDGPNTTVAAQRLMSGFYVNELLLKLTQRCDPHPEIFQSYASCVEGLCAGAGEGPHLRRFEKRLLNDLGYGLELTRTDAGLPVEPTGYYRFAVQGAAHPCVAEAPGAVYGQSLADLEAEVFGDARSLRDAKRVLRAAIDACLDGRSLKSREVMRAMRGKQPEGADAGAEARRRSAKHGPNGGRPSAEWPNLDRPKPERPNPERSNLEKPHRERQAS